MALGFRAITTYQTPGPGNEAAASVTVNKPTGTAQNDILIAMVAASANATPTITTPSGWTLLDSSTAIVQTTTSTYYKVAGASEPASYTWTLSGSASYDVTAFIAAYSGGNTTTPVDKHAIAASTATTVLATTVDGDFILSIYAGIPGNGVSITAPGAPVTQRGSVAEDDNHTNFDSAMWWGDESQSTHGNTTSRTGTGASVAASIAIEPAAAVAALPPPGMRHGRQRKRTPHIKAKHAVRNSIQLRIPQAPPAIFPPALRHQGQRKRTPRVRPKQRVVSNIQLRIPQAPFPNFPSIVRRQQQKKIVPKIRAKRRVTSYLLQPETRIPPLPAKRTTQRRRIPQIKPKRIVRSSIELRIPQAPPPILPLPGRRTNQRKRIPRIWAKRVVRSSIQLRIPQAPAPVVSGFPNILQRRQQPKRVPRIKAKRTLSSSIQLRIPPRPLPELALPDRRSGQRKRIPHIAHKHPVRNANQLLIPQAPPTVTPTPPPALRHAAQRKHVVKVRAKRIVRGKPTLAAVAGIRLLTGRIQKKHQPIVKAKRALKLALRMVQTPQPVLPTRRIHRASRPLWPHRRRAFSSLALKIPQAPAVVAQAPLPVFTRHRLLRHRSAIFKALKSVRRFRLLSGAPVPAVVAGPEAIVIWRHRANMQ